MKLLIAISNGLEYKFPQIINNIFCTHSSDISYYFSVFCAYV